MVVGGGEGESKSGRISKLGKIKFPPRVDNAPRRGAFEERETLEDEISNKGENLFLIKFIETPFEE